MQKSKKLSPRVLVTGMHTLKKFGNTIETIRKDELPITRIVKISENDDMLQALSKEILGIREYCQKNRPDAILILGDRDEPFAAAIVGIHLDIPVIHVSGGRRKWSHGRQLLTQCELYLFKITFNTNQNE